METVCAVDGDSDVERLFEELERDTDVTVHKPQTTNSRRRALTVRDGGCVFPGCNAPAAWCDAHHVNHFEDGGPTDLNNLALLCRHHHGITHRTGWTMKIAPPPDDESPPSHFIWTTPDGHQLHSQHWGLQTRPNSNNAA